MEQHLLTLYKILSTSELFKDIDQKNLQYIISHAHRIRCNKNEYINIKNDQKSYFYLIEKGDISLSRVTPNGDSYIVDIITKGNQFGITNLFEENLEPHMLAEAIETSFLWLIPIYILRELMEKDTLFARNVLRMILKTRIAKDNDLEHRVVQNASQRLCCFLLHHCGRNSESSGEIELPYSKKHIAQKLAIQQETFSRALKIISKETGTKITGSKLFIKDINRLKSYACKDCSIQCTCDNQNLKYRIY